METKPDVMGAASQSIPWTTRDTWLGIVVFGLWLVAYLAVAVLIRMVELSVNAGLLIAIAELLFLVPVWWFTVRKYGAGWDALGLRAFRGSFLSMGCGLMILSFLFNAAYGLFLSQFGLRTQIDLIPVFAELSYPLILFVAGAIIAPVVEEIFFRGFVFAGLRPRYGWKKAALISSLLFALIHLQPTAFLPIFLLGLIFALLYQYSGSIWPAILMHFATNALGLGVAYLAAELNLPM